MPGVHLIPPQGIKRTNLISSDTRHNHFIPTQGFTSGGGAVENNMEYQNIPLDWFDLDFQQRIPLTINAGQVPTTQTDFPLLINDIYPDLIGEVEAEIRFAGSDNVQLEYEIEKFDNSTGELVAWVKKPTVDDGDFIAIYFDNPGASDEQNPNAVWDVNYVQVCHLNGTGTDSTANAQNFTIFGTTTVSSQIGQGLNFSGIVTDYLIRNPFSGFPTTELTCEFLLKTTDSGEGMVSYAIGSTGGEDNHFLLLDQQNVQIFIVNAADFSTEVDFNDGVFHHMVVTWRSSDGQLILYKDGVNVSSRTHRTGFSFTNNGSLVLGQDQDNVGGGFAGAMAYDGILDELRLSNKVRSADNILTSFNNQSSPSTFYTTGAVESAPSVTIDIMEFQDPLLGNMEFQS